MTEQAWQERYEITSTKGRIWKRVEIRKRAVEMLKSLLPGVLSVTARRVAVQLVLDDATFMRPRRGMVPARVIEDAAIEAMFRLSREGSALAEQIALVDKTLAEIKTEDHSKIKAKTADERINHAEAMSSRYLGNYNEDLAAGRTKGAEKMLAKSQYWLDMANKLRGWGEDE